MTDRCTIDAIKTYSLVAITGTTILLPIKSCDMNSWRASTRRCIFKRVLGPCEFINGYSIFKWWRRQIETFSRYWPFVRGIHRPSVNSPHKGQWRGALMFSLICAWINGSAKNCNAGDLRRHHAHYDVTIMRQLDLIGHQASSPINDRQAICHIAPRVCHPQPHKLTTKQQWSYLGFRGRLRGRVSLFRFDRYNVCFYCFYFRFLK